MSTTHTQKLIQKWQNKNTSLIGKHNSLVFDKTIANGVEIIAINRERTLIYDFINDLKEPVIIKESDLLPSHYIPVQMPVYEGNGSHNVRKLEEIINQFIEFSHQMKVREQSLIQSANIQIVK